MKRWDWIKFLGIELSCVGIEEVNQEFPWKDVDACMGNVVEPPIEGMRVTCPKCGKELRWIRFIVQLGHGSKNVDERVR